MTVSFKCYHNLGFCLCVCETKDAWLHFFFSSSMHVVWAVDCVSEGAGLTTTQFKFLKIYLSLFTYWEMKVQLSSVTPMITWWEPESFLQFKKKNPFWCILGWWDPASPWLWSVISDENGATEYTYLTSSQRPQTLILHSHVQNKDYAPKGNIMKSRNSQTN